MEVVLSLGKVKLDTVTEDGHNVVLHEFAQLDQEDGKAEILQRTSDYPIWAKVAR